METYNKFENTWLPTVGACYGVAWKRLWPNIVPLTVGLIVSVILLAPVAIPFVGWIYLIFVAPPIYCGLSHTEMKAVKGGRVEFRDLFIGFQYWGKCVGTFLIIWAACFAILLFLIVGAILAGIGGLGSKGGMTVIWLGAVVFFAYAGARVMFMWEFIIYQNLGPVEALKASWNILEGSMWTLTLINTVAIGAIILGFFALFVGAIPAVLLMGMAQSALLVALQPVKSQSEYPLPPKSIAP